MPNLWKRQNRTAEDEPKKQKQNKLKKGAQRLKLVCTPKSLHLFCGTRNNAPTLSCVESKHDLSSCCSVWERHSDEESSYVHAAALLQNSLSGKEINNYPQPIMQILC